MFKRIILLAALMSLMGYTLVAQNDEDPWIWPDDIITDEWSFNLDLGPKLGFGMSSPTTPTLYNFDFHNGFCYHFGISANGRFAYRLSKNPHGLSRIGFGIEALFSGKTIKTDMDAMNMLSLEVPILVKFYFTSKISLEAGTTLVAPLKVNPEVLQIQNTVLNVGEMKAADAMLTFGAAYQVYSGLAFGLRCNIGTSKMAENLDSRTSTFLFTASYSFPIVNQR